MNKKKNVIKLKNVPSNSIEEAIIVLKDSCNERSKCKDFMFSEDFKSKKKAQNDLVVKEAELIISNYLKQDIEETNNLNNINTKYKVQNRRLKIFNIFLVILAAVFIFV